MGDEFLEVEYKFLLITLDKIMKTDDLTQLRSMFTHAEERLELIFRTRYKKLIDKEVVKETKKLITQYIDNDIAFTQALYKEVEQ